MGPGSSFPDTYLSAPVPGRVLQTYLPSTGQSSCRPCIHSTQWLVKNESILWQVLFARQQGGRGGGKLAVDGAKGGWPEALLAGRVECLQTCYFPAQKRACKDHSCWVTPEFISQLIKEASFSPSFPFLLCISGVVHRQTRPGSVQLALAWRVGRRRRRAMHTNTYFRQSWFSGAGLGTAGCPGHWGRAFRTQGLIILLSHEACSCSSQEEAMLMSETGEQFFFIKHHQYWGWNPFELTQSHHRMARRAPLTFAFHRQSRKDLEACHIVTKVTTSRNWDLNLC